MSNTHMSNLPTLHLNASYNLQLSHQKKTLAVIFLQNMDNHKYHINSWVSHQKEEGVVDGHHGKTVAKLQTTTEQDQQIINQALLTTWHDISSSVCGSHNEVYFIGNVVRFPAVVVVRTTRYFEGNIGSFSALVVATTTGYSFKTVLAH